MYDNRCEYTLKENDKLETEEYIYCIEKIIGFGGTSIVYLANRIDKSNPEDKKKVAVKELFFRNDGSLIRKDGEITYSEDSKNIYDYYGETLYDKYKREFENEPKLINHLSNYCSGVVDSYSYKLGLQLNGKKVNNYYLFLESFDDNGKLLCDIIDDYKKTFSCDRLNLIDALKIVKLILISLDEIHNNSNEKCGKWIHGDIKIENIYFKTSNLQFNDEEYLHIEKARIKENRLGIASFLDLSTAKKVILNDDGVYKTEELNYDSIAHSEPCAPEIIKGFDGILKEISSYEDIFSSIFEEEKTTVKLTRSVDVFSVGIILYEMLSGEKFLGSPSNSYNIYHHSFKYEDKHLIDCTSDICIDLLNEILDRALAFSPEERYASAKEFLKDIEELENTIQGNGFSKNVLLHKTESILNNMKSVFTKIDGYLPNCYTKNSDKEVIEDYLENEFEDQNIFILGQGGIGKSTAVKKYMRRLLEDKLKVPIYINLESNLYHLKKERSFNYILNSICDAYFDTDEKGQNGKASGADIIRKMESEFSKKASKSPEYILVIEDLHKLQDDLKRDVIFNIEQLSGYSNLQVILTSRYNEEKLDMHYDLFEIKPLSEECISSYLEKNNLYNIENDSLNELIKIPIYLNMFLDLNDEINYDEYMTSSKLILEYLKSSLKNYMKEIGDNKIVLSNGIFYSKELIEFLINNLLAKATYFSYHKYSIDYDTFESLINTSLPLIYNGEGYDEDAEFLQDRFEEYDELFNELNDSYEKKYKGRPYKKVNKYRIKDILDIFVEHLGLLIVNEDKKYIFPHDIYFEFFRDFYLFDKFKWVYEERDILPLMKYTYLFLPEINFDGFPKKKLFCEQMVYFFKEKIIFVIEELEDLIIRFSSVLEEEKNSILKKKVNLNINLFNYMENTIKLIIECAFENIDNNLIYNEIFNKKNDLQRNVEFYKNNFDIYQLYQIYLGYSQKISVYEYKNKNYSWNRMREIRLGLLNLIDVSLIKNINFDDLEINFIRLGLQNKLNVNEILSKFSYNQIIEITEGLNIGIDIIYIRLCLNKSFSFLQMREIRYGLISRYSKYLKEYIDESYTPEQIREIRYALESGINIDDLKQCIEKSCSPNLIREIRYILKNDINIKYLKRCIKKSYNPGLIREIRYALENGVSIDDLKQYIDESYTSEQIREIRYALESGVSIDDLKQYINKVYTPDIIREIRYALENNIDVKNLKQYIDKNYTFEQIREIRYALESGISINDLKRCIIKSYTPEQICKVRYALESKYKEILVTYIEKYHLPDQINEMRYALESNLKIENEIIELIDEFYTSEQIREIIYALETGISIEVLKKYINKLHTPEQIRKIRYDLYKKSINFGK